MNFMLILIVHLSLLNVYIPYAGVEASQFRFKKSHIEGGKNSVPANDVLGSNIEVISGKTCIFSVGVIKVA